MATAFRWNLRGAFLAVTLLGIAAAGCKNSSSQGMPDLPGGNPNRCMTSNDCAAGVCRMGQCTCADCLCPKNGSGVCRNDRCTRVPCSEDSGCPGSEVCSGGQCEPFCDSPPPPRRPQCMVSADCVADTVCRDGACAVVACGQNMPCLATETCSGRFVCTPTVPAPKGTPGRSIAAGGSISTSGKHIHIGLTGQGKAIGTGSSASHKHVGGATAVMQR